MTYEQRLVQTYLQARERVIAAIERRLRLGQPYSQQRALLKIINKELGQLGIDAADLQGVHAQASFLQGAVKAYQEAKHPDTMPAYSYFTGLHKGALAVCVENAKAYAQISARLIARQAADMVRDLGLEATTTKLSQNLTWQEMRKSLEGLLADNDFVTVPWRNNKGNMRVDSYAELVVRTTTNEATTEGLFAEMERLGEGLVKMTSYSPTCPICATRQGRVYRLGEYPADDERSKFPHISMALPRWPTYKTVHPNCRHRLGPMIWSERSRAEKEADLARAGDPFGGDPRGEREIAAYQKTQDIKRARLTDRKQWEDYRAVLGEENVPTFSGFRAMKKASSERYQELLSDYRQARREYGIIEVAKVPGGRHYGKYLDMSGYTDAGLERTLASMETKIRAHQDKLSNPVGFDNSWTEKDERAREGLLRHWQKEITNFEEQSAIARYLLKDRGRGR